MSRSQGRRVFLTSRFLAIIERAAHLGRTEKQLLVFAIDIAWEPRLGPYASRRRFDADWRAWLNEQYGSIEHA